MTRRSILTASGGQTYSVLEIHVDTPEGGHISSARVEIAYDGNSNIGMTDNKGIALFSDIPTGKEITYKITKVGYNAASGTWIIDADVEYETKYVVLTKPLPTQDTILFQRNYLEENSGVVNITIPAGCNVLAVTLTVNADADDGNAPEGNSDADIVNNSNGKVWNELAVDVPQFEYATETRTQYVGVTASKTYKVRVRGSISACGYAHVVMKYSQSINNKTPNVIDRDTGSSGGGRNS